MKKETLRRVRNLTKLIKKYPTWQEEKGEYKIYRYENRSRRTFDGLYYFDVIPHIKYGKVKMV